MVGEWIAKNFFSLASDSRSAAEALARAENNAEFYQKQYPDDYVYVVYLDIKRNRFGLVFSNKSFEALKSWDLVKNNEKTGLMLFDEMIINEIESVKDSLVNEEQITSLINNVNPAISESEIEQLIINNLESLNLERTKSQIVETLSREDQEEIIKLQVLEQFESFQSNATNESLEELKLTLADDIKANINEEDLKEEAISRLLLELNITREEIIEYAASRLEQEI